MRKWIGFGIALCLLTGPARAQVLPVPALEETGIAAAAERETAAAARPVPPPVTERPMMRGDRGEDVREVQRALVTLGFMDGKCDGAFGPATAAGVVTLQEYLAVLACIETGEAAEEADGRVDGELAEMLLSGGIAPCREELTRGSRGDEVKRLQRRLSNLGYLRSPADGQYGGKTGSAVSAFQKTMDLPVTGEADICTQILLFGQAAKACPIPEMPYVLKINTARQTVYAYTFDVSTMEYTSLVRSMACSTGLYDTPTPTGTFSSATGPVARWGYFPKWDVYAQYLYRITGGILFHSVLYTDSNESTLIEGSLYKLGQRASHGCVRLSVADAKWIYEHCPAGTTVIVY